MQLVHDKEVNAEDEQVFLMKQQVREDPKYNLNKAHKIPRKLRLFTLGCQVLLELLFCESPCYNLHELSYLSPCLMFVTFPI